MEAKAITRNRN